MVANPNDRNALNDLAWMQATCPDDEFRDAKKAFDNANKAYQLDGARGQRCLPEHTRRPHIMPRIRPSHKPGLITKGDRAHEIGPIEKVHWRPAQIVPAIPTLS